VALVGSHTTVLHKKTVELLHRGARRRRPRPCRHNNIQEPAERFLAALALERGAELKK